MYFLEEPFGGLAAVVGFVVAGVEAGEGFEVGLHVLLGEGFEKGGEGLLEGGLGGEGRCFLGGGFEV